MFGTNDTTQQSNDDSAMLDNVKQLVNDPASQTTTDQPQYMTASSQQPSVITPQVPQTPVTNADLLNNSQSTYAEPAQGFSSSNSAVNPLTPMQSQMSQADDNGDGTTTDINKPVTTSPMTPVDPEHLAGMKQQALDHLEPLVGHLDQTPEEAFKTTMMMIQANDNHTLLEKALEEAKKIEDDEARANALLDIINEINYFSQVSQE